MVAYACRHVPYYRETLARLGLMPGDFRTVEDLAKLPVIERREIQRDPERFVSDAVPRRRLRAAHTSGSSGRPIRVYKPRDLSWRASARSERMRRTISGYTGKGWFYRETRIFTGAAFAPEPRRSDAHRTSRPRGFPILRQSLSILEPPARNAKLIAEFKPDVLISSGSYLGMLFPYVHESGCAFHRPKVVIYGGDGMSEPVRQLIMREFDVPVLCTYQSIEASRIAWECEQHAGLHCNIDLYPVRIVDDAGRSVPVGESGDVVVSNLVNRGTVLLNYRQGDIAALLPDPCPCGRSLPLMSLPQGRTDDVLVLPSGRRASAAILNRALDVERLLWQWQAVQETRGKVRVQLVVNDACDRQALCRRVQGLVREKLDEDLRMDFEFVASIERTPAGKHRTIVSKIPEVAARATDAPAMPGEEGAEP
jgi:phenylacetate-CoA ligase